MFRDLYRINSESISEGRYTFGLTLDASHRIYQVHFPGTPITPGACQLEILRQLAGRAVGSGVSILEVRNIKYLRVISPETDPDITVEETVSGTEVPGIFKCSAVICAGDTVFTKTSFTFKTEK